MKKINGEYASYNHAGISVKLMYNDGLWNVVKTCSKTLVTEVETFGVCSIDEDWAKTTFREAVLKAIKETENGAKK